MKIQKFKIQKYAGNFPANFVLLIWKLRTCNYEGKICNRNLLCGKFEMQNKCKQY